MSDNTCVIPLDKYMYFIPNRFFVDGKELFVSFNVGVIPVDMDVTDASIFVPLNAGVEERRFEVKAIESGWDENRMATGTRPVLSRGGSRLVCGEELQELRISVVESMHRWRFESLTNHGIHVRRLGVRLSDYFRPSLPFSNDKPPYLVAATL